MQAYKFQTFITNKGMIAQPLIEPTLYNKQVEIIVVPLTEIDSQPENVSEAKTAIKSQKMNNAGFGCAKGRFFFREDFDMPLDDFKEYM